MDLAQQKSAAREAAKMRRAAAHKPNLITPAAIEVINHLPAHKFKDAVIGGVWPLQGELDVRPLMAALYDHGHQLSLPCTPPSGNPLTFRKWKPTHTLKAGPYKTREPYPEQPVMTPTFVLVPLLAFTSQGHRLGYGGGYYDRTLARLRGQGPVFACGVAYAAQEAPDLPTDEYDQPLDGILTEQYFKVFK